MKYRIIASLIVLAVLVVLVLWVTHTPSQDSSRPAQSSSDDAYKNLKTQ